MVSDSCAVVKPKLSGNRLVLAYPLPTRDSAVRLTPLSILYPGALFESQGCDVKYWDERYDSLDELDDWLRGATDFGVSSFTGFQVGQAVRLLKRAKKINPSITNHLGGYHARLLPEQCLREPFVDEIWTDRSYGEDKFPFSEATKRHWARGDFQFYTSRGCPFPCTFCALRSPWEPKPIADLDRELKTLHDAVGFTSASFSDPNISFGVYKDSEGKTERMNRVQRMREIGQIMRDIGVDWDSNIRSPYLTPEMVDVLSWGRCTSIEIGAESGDDYYLTRVIHKGHHVESTRQAALNVRGSGISIMYSFLCNGPFETREMRNNTFDLIDWIVATDTLARVSIYSYAAYPGSPLYDFAVKGEGCGGEYACQKFTPPETMAGWGELRLMMSPVYWVSGLTFRRDATSLNFEGEDYKLIEPYVELAKRKWRERDVDDFPCDEVEALVQAQVLKGNARAAEAFKMASA